MTDLERFGASTTGSRSSRLAGRALARQTARDLAAIDHSTEVRSAQVSAAGKVQQAKVDAAARTGAYAMEQVALVAQMQQQFALAAPTASGDLDG